MPTGYYDRPDPFARIRAKTVVMPNGCWETNKHAFRPMIWVMGERVTIYRWLAHLKFGVPMNSDLDVCHDCDNPRCYRPSHLFWGTRQENVMDAINKGLPFVGTNVTTAHQRDLIKQLYVRGTPRKEITRQMKVSAATVDRILSGKVYDPSKDPKET